MREGHQPGAQLAQGKQQQVAGLRMLRQLRRQAEALAHASAEPEQRAGQAGPEEGSPPKNRRPSPAGRASWGKRSSSSARASWNWLPHNATGLFAPWNCFSRLVRVSPISPSTPPSLSLAFLGHVAQLFQLFQQVGALPVVLQGLDDLVQRLFQLRIADLLATGGTPRQRVPAAPRRPAASRTERRRGTAAGPPGRGSEG